MKKIIYIIIAVVAIVIALFSTARREESYPYAVNAGTPEVIPVSSEIPLNFKLFRSYSVEGITVLIYEGNSVSDISGNEPVATLSKEFNYEGNSIDEVALTWKTPDTPGDYIVKYSAYYYDENTKKQSPEIMYLNFSVAKPCYEHTFEERKNSVNGNKGTDADCYTHGTVYNYCTTCGYEEQIETDYLHVYGNGVVISNANCTDLGYETFECKKCGHTKVEIIQNDTESHRIRAIVKVEPTATRPGSVWFECDRCNYIEPYNTEIPALFMDIDPALYYEQPVAWAYDMGVFGKIKGYQFEPDKECTNAIAISLMYFLNGVGVTEKDANPFADVKEGDYYRDAAKWAYKYGVVDTELFMPDMICTRAMLAEYLWHRAGSPKVKLNETFTDVPADASYAMAVSWAVENGIASGMSEEKFEPDRKCTQAQVLTFLYRFLNK